MNDIQVQTTTRLLSVLLIVGAYFAVFAGMIAQYQR